MTTRIVDCAMGLQLANLCDMTVNQVAEFFSALLLAEDDVWFHPHSFSLEEAERRVAYCGRDSYLALSDGKAMVAYGMLRGWDDGFEIPSLGIAVHPAHKGKGIGKCMMAQLHMAATEKGAAKVRLTVHSQNIAAISLYESLGYTFREENRDKLIGEITLTGAIDTIEPEEGR